MGRSLLTAPLGVLHEQLVELRAQIAFDAFAAALRGAGLDAGALLAEVDAALGEAMHAAVSLRIARGERDLVTARRLDWRRAYAAWAGDVRAMLGGAPGVGAREAAEVRRRLGRYPGRSFQDSLECLERSLSALRTHSCGLGLPGWPFEPLGPAERLLSEAAAILAADVETAARHAECSAAATAARRRCQDTIRRLRSAWGVVRVVRPELPDLQLEVLRAYVPAPRTRPDPSPSEPGETVGSDPEPFKSDPRPSTRDQGPSRRDREAFPGDGFQFRNDREGFTSDPARLTGAFVGFTVPGSPDDRS